jgi:hypothetical protein
MEQCKRHKIYRDLIFNDDDFFDKEMNDLFSYSIDNFLPEAASELKQEVKQEVNENTSDMDSIFTDRELFKQPKEAYTDLFQRITWIFDGTYPYGETLNSSLGASGYVSKFKLPCVDDTKMFEVICNRNFNTVREVLCFVCKQYKVNGKYMGKNQFGGFKIFKDNVWKMKFKPLL